MFPLSFRGSAPERGGFEIPLLAVLPAACLRHNAADAPLGATCNAGTVVQVASSLSATTSSSS